MPAKRVLLVGRDLEALGTLAERLRTSGMRVALASGAQMACERAKTGDYDVIVATSAVAAPEDGAIGLSDALSVELGEAPPMIVLDASSADPDDVAQRIDALSRTGARRKGASLAPTAHALDGVALGDLLLVLAMERRSGTVTVSTPQGAGEVRLVEGDIADAVYVRLEGLKAITRMLGEREGTATFTPGAPAIMRRLHQPTRAIVQETRALSRRFEALRESAGELVSGTLLTVDGGPTEGLSELDLLVLARLRVPATIDELLDELPHADAAALESAMRLQKLGRIKRIGDATSRVQLCGADQLHLVRASASRARVSGFGGPARVVFAATPARLAVFGHTVLALADAYPSQEASPSAPMPYTVGAIRLGEGVELEIVGLPLVPVYAPLWQLALAGSAIVVRLDDGARQQLEEAAATVGVAALDARAIFGVVDETSPVQVASLIKMALDAHAG